MTAPLSDVCHVVAALVSQPQTASQVEAVTPLCHDLTRLPLPAGLDATPARWMQAGQWPQWTQEVRERVTPERWEHIKRVALLAAQIAYAAGLDTRRAYAAGILHDLARDLSAAELLQLAPPECALDREAPLSVHGRAARALLETLGFPDAAVLGAVEDHVTGPRPEADDIAGCVYVADVSEPARGVNDDIRALALRDLPAALREAIASKVKYLEGRGLTVHPRTLKLYRWLQEPSGAGAANTEKPA